VTCPRIKNKERFQGVHHFTVVERTSLSRDFDDIMGQFKLILKTIWFNLETCLQIFLRQINAQEDAKHNELSNPCETHKVCLILIICY
jgi:hypothetical protein